MLRKRNVGWSARMRGEERSDSRCKGRGQRRPLGGWEKEGEMDTGRERGWAERSMGVREGGWAGTGNGWGGEREYVWAEEKG